MLMVVLRLYKCIFANFSKLRNIYIKKFATYYIAGWVETRLGYIIIQDEVFYFTEIKETTYYI